MTTLIHPGERLDELHPYGLFILQHPDAFRFGTDAVLLAHFARAKKQHRVLDLGTGTGIQSTLQASKYSPTWRIWRSAALATTIWPPLSIL